MLCSPDPLSSWFSHQCSLLLRLIPVLLRDGWRVISRDQRCFNGTEMLGLSRYSMTRFLVFWVALMNWATITGDLAFKRLIVFSHTFFYGFSWLNYRSLPYCPFLAMDWVSLDSLSDRLTSSYPRGSFRFPMIPSQFQRFVCVGKKCGQANE